MRFKFHDIGVLGPCGGQLDEAEEMAQSRFCWYGRRNLDHWLEYE